VVTRATQWRLRHGDGEQSPWSAKETAERLLAKWDRSAETLLEEAADEVTKARKEFIAETDVRIVSVRNPNPFQVDHRKPTLAFPDGSEMQFEEGTSEEQIKAAMEEAAHEAHPDPYPPKVRGERPELEERQVWERELLTSKERTPFPAVEAWDHFFPMDAVAETLDELSQKGWSLVSVSEDRGLYKSALAENRSAPLLVRYLLVREDGVAPPP
jgi:hypothetical protein